ncbi:spore germination protein [Paenibacillus thalictri]|uniref:Spore germination protein n=1 Tax=Paenibacillus thalictri TaxID=2527873 RepID=A0A4Q9DIJ4_9BACL|nr:spore germination protein [Paenibacillus thalictri]TBL73054.1 spore germination protein [Paenibacillus thalictri]
MPSIILAPIKFVSISDDSTVNFGDVLQITPKSTSKAFAGGGGGNTGDWSVSISVISFTNTIDPDVNDSNNAGNN